jgi:hypothetical protein
MATLNVDIPASQVRIINRGGVSGDEFSTELADVNSPGDVLFAGGTLTPATTMFVVQWGDQAADGSFTLPDPPAGYTLTGAFYTAIGYRLSGEESSGWGDPGFGTSPEPQDSPFLEAVSGADIVIDGFPVGAYGDLVVGRTSQDLADLADGTFADQWFVGAWNGTSSYDAHLHLGYLGLRLVYENGEVDTPCDTWVDLDLSTAVFVDSGSGILGQYVDGVITGLDGLDAHYSFGLTLDATKPYGVEVTFDPTSSHDGDGNPVTSDRFVLLRDYLPGDEVTAGDDVQIGDGFSNTADVCTLTIGPGLGNWDDEDFGVTQGYTGLRFLTPFSGAVSAIRIRKICTCTTPPLVQWPRNDALGASSARVLWPIPKTEQASNLRGPSAIL